MMNDRIIITFNEGNVAEIEVNDSIRIFKINEDAGTSLQLNTETGVLSLLDKKGNVISQVDFPTEKIITNAYYDYASQELVLEFENAPVVRIPIKTDLDNYFTKEEVYSKEQIDKKLEDFDSTNYSVLVGQETVASEGGWQGTPVPNSGYVEKIYFNTNLSVDEVVAIIKKANLDYNSDFGFNMYPVLTDGISEMVLIVPTDNGYKFGNEVVGGVYFNSDTGGWKENFNGEIQINGNLMTEAQGMTLGTQNDLLSSLFSITPFTKSSGGEKTTLYQMNADGTLNKDKPIKILTADDVLEIVNNAYENGDEVAY